MRFVILPRDANRYRIPARGDTYTFTAHFVSRVLRTTEKNRWLRPFLARRIFPVGTGLICNGEKYHWLCSKLFFEGVRQMTNRTGVSVNFMNIYMCLEALFVGEPKKTVLGENSCILLHSVSPGSGGPRTKSNINPEVFPFQRSNIFNYISQSE